MNTLKAEVRADVKPRSIWRRAIRATSIFLGVAAFLAVFASLFAK
jgi:hypothetical protein